MQTRHSCLRPSWIYCSLSVGKENGILLNIHGKILTRCRALHAAAGAASRGGRPSLILTHPELAQEWHPTKNGDRRPEHFSAGSTASKLWWLCQQRCEVCGKAHEWETVISNRTGSGRGSGCAVCSGYKVCECNSLAAKRPDLLLEWDYDSNISMEPSALGTSSHRKASWICATHGSYTAPIDRRCNFGQGCSECAKVKRLEKFKKRGLLKDEKPELVAQLHPTKNAHIDLDKVTSGSGKSAVWVCHERKNSPPGCTHPHEWTAGILNRAGNERRKGGGCPFCFGRAVCPCNSLAVKAPEIAAQWHPMRNGNKHPNQVGSFSTLKVWWQHKSELTSEAHEWEARINCRVLVWERERRFSCPKCWRERRGRLISRDA